MSDLLRPNSLIKILGGRSIYLVGMMGSGKSRTGPHLAKALQYSFLDQDLLIEKVAKMSILEIFQKEGEASFRNIETQVLKEIAQRHSLVIATGGGVVTRPENWGVLHQGIVVWLNLSKDRLLSRLESDSNKRPLLEANNSIDSFDSLIKERYPLYSESDLHISVQDETPEEVALEIVSKLSNILIDEADQGAQQTIAT